MKKCIYWFISILFVSHIDTTGQVLFPDLEGENLLEELRREYKPAFTLTYSEARDTLYAKILNNEDSLSCVYTGYTIWLDPERNPRQDAFEKGINAEHLWPRSKGASHTQPEADLHHIYPCREDVNNFRGNLPFEELTDEQTIWWYYLDIRTQQTPVQNKSLYSRLGVSSFTPPVHKKGDIARAMMYFYTMYGDLADQADPHFFEQQRETLCKWHFEDPADLDELDKTHYIALFQDDKPNPFVLDCTIPERTYCADLDLFCTIIPGTKESAFNLSVNVIPIPVHTGSVLQLNLPSSGKLIVVITDILGRTIIKKEIPVWQQGEVSVTEDIFQFTRDQHGVFILQAYFSGPSGHSNGVKKLFVSGQ